MPELIKQLDQACRKLLPREAAPVGDKLYTTYQVKPSGKCDMEALAAEWEGLHGIQAGVYWEGALPVDQAVLRFQEEGHPAHLEQQAI